MESKVINMEDHNKFRGMQGSFPNRYDIIGETINEISATTEEPNNGSDDMATENKDLLFDELKKDMREREERSRRETSEREDRFLKQMEQFSQEAKEREERYRIEAKERELRISNTVTELKNDFKEAKKEIHQTSKDIKNLSITTVIAIAGIAITVFLSSVL